MVVFRGLWCCCNAEVEGVIAIGSGVSWKAESARGGVCGRDRSVLEIEVFEFFLTMMGSGS